MSSALKIRWIVVCCVWGGALILTFWNSLKIDGVTHAREKSEQIRREIVFQRQNTLQLSQILATQNAMYLPVESVDLGIVAARSRLQSLAAAFGLKEFKLLVETAQMSEEQAPFALSAQGPLPQVVGFLTALQKYLYLKPTQTRIMTARESGWVDLEIRLLLQYRISSPEEPGPAVPETQSPSLASASGGV